MLFYIMNFFSNSVPNLISKKSLKNIERMAHVSNPVKETTVGETLGYIYSTFIEPNLFVLILMFVFILFLLYKYYAKELDKNDVEKFRATFNPNQQINTQNSYVRYLPDEIPQIIDDKLVNRNDLEPPVIPPKEYPPFVLNTNNRDVYTGTYNTYANSIDSNIPHPFDWPMDYNATTGSAVQFMSDRNKQNLNELNNISLMQTNNMIDSNLYNDINEHGNPYFTLEKPYLT